MTLGAIVLIAASWLFGGVSADVLTGDPLTVVDQFLADWFQAHAEPLVTQLMLVVSSLHGVYAISIYAVLFAIYLLWKRDWFWLVCLVTTLPGGMLLNALMKHAFQRARPNWGDPLIAFTTYSYPSGHVAGSALFYGVLVAMLITRIDAWRWRVLIAFAAITVVLLVALSRMALGVHFLSDVIAAIAEAVAWLTICLMATHAWWKRRSKRLHGQNPRESE